MTDIPPPLDDWWFRLIFGFVVGAALGSFATMLAYRLPRRMSIVTPRSHCPSCKKLLQARDLMPLLSWLWTQGKCRYCRADIGARYLWIELGTSLACAIASVIIGFTVALPLAYAGIVVAVAGLGTLWPRKHG